MFKDVDGEAIYATTLTGIILSYRKTLLILYFANPNYSFMYQSTPKVNKEKTQESMNVYASRLETGSDYAQYAYGGNPNDLDGRVVFYSASNNESERFHVIEMSKDKSATYKLGYLFLKYKPFFDEGVFPEKIAREIG